jgi:hypothetical protein
MSNKYILFNDDSWQFTPRERFGLVLEKEQEIAYITFGRSWDMDYSSVADMLRYTFGKLSLISNKFF